jgi:hypothetical protein
MQALDVAFFYISPAIYSIIKPLMIMMMMIMMTTMMMK